MNNEKLLLEIKRLKFLNKRLYRNLRNRKTRQSSQLKKLFDSFYNRAKDIITDYKTLILLEILFNTLVIYVVNNGINSFYYSDFINYTKNIIQYSNNIDFKKNVYNFINLYSFIIPKLEKSSITANLLDQVLEKKSLLLVPKEFIILQEPSYFWSNPIMQFFIMEWNNFGI